MMKKLDVYKAAATRLSVGVDRVVVGADVYEIFECVWGIVLRDVLARFPWNFAVKRFAACDASVAMAACDRSGWDWVVPVPLDFVRFAGLMGDCTLIGRKIYGKTGKVEFDYVCCVEEFVCGSGSFCLALALRLAAECSDAVTGRNGAKLMQEYEAAALPRAMAEGSMLRGVDLVIRD